MTGKEGFHHESVTEVTVLGHQRWTPLGSPEKRTGCSQVCPLRAERQVPSSTVPSPLGEGCSRDLHSAALGLLYAWRWRGVELSVQGILTQNCLPQLPRTSGVGSGGTRGSCSILVGNCLGLRAAGVWGGNEVFRTIESLCAPSSHGP